MSLDNLLARLDRCFDFLLARVRGRAPKRLKLEVTPALSLAGLYDASARSEGDVKPDPAPLRTLLDVAEGYLEAERASARAAVTRAAQGDDPEDVRRDLAEVRDRAVRRVATILEAEGTAARNLGGLEGAGKVAAAMGLDDPLCFFVVCRDEHLCEECRRLHLLPDGTPRVWRRSEIGQGYHKKGDEQPKVGGCHPRCRCTLCMLLPGYGFKDGRVSYVSPNHDELARQRS